MRFIPFAFALLFLAYSAAPQQLITLYINNANTNSGQNGQSDAPYSTFAKAFTNNISNAAVGSNISVIFINTGTPYTLNFTLDGLNLGKLELQSEVNIVPTSTCNSFPTVIIQHASFLDNNVTFLVNALTVQLANNSNVGFNFGQGFGYHIAINNSCLEANTNLPNAIMFNMKGLGNANILLAGTNISNTAGNLSQIFNVFANSQVNFGIIQVFINLANSNNFLTTLFSVTGGPGISNPNSLSISQLNVTGNYNGESLFTFFHVDNIEINNFAATNFNMPGKSKLTYNSFFLVTAASTVFAQDIYITNTNSSGLHFIFLDNLQISEMTGIDFQTVQVINCQNISLLDSHLDSFQLNLSSVTILQSHFMVAPFVYLSSKSTSPPKNSIRHLFNNFVIMNNTFHNGFLDLEHVDEKNSLIEDVIPAYILTTLAFKVQNNIIKFNAFINTGAVSVFMETATFSGNQIHKCRLLTARQVLTNLAILNSSFSGEVYVDVSILKSPATPKSEAVNNHQLNLMIYKVASIIGCTFQNINLTKESSLLMTASPFVIMDNNTFENIYLGSSSLITITGILHSDLILLNAFNQRNKTIETEIFGSNAVVFRAFQSLFASTPNCGGGGNQGCYYAAIVNNNIQGFTANPGDGVNIIELNYGSDSITHYEVANNTFTNLKFTSNFFRGMKRNNAFNAYSNTFTNLHVNNIFIVESSSNSFQFQYNSIFNSNFSKAFEIEILQSQSLIELVYNYIVNSTMQGVFHIFSPSHLNLSIYNTLVLNSRINTHAYTPLRAIFIQFTSDRANSYIVLNNNFFKNINMSHTISIPGFFPAIENNLIQIQTFYRSQVYLSNNTIEYLNNNASLSNVIDIQAGNIYVYTLLTTNINLQQALGFGYSFQAGAITLSNLQFLNNKISVPEAHLGTHGLVYCAYNQIHSNQNLVNITGVLVQNWITVNPAFFIDVPNLNLIVTNFIGNYSGQGFLIASQTATITLTKILYQTRDNQFLVMTNQPGNVTLSINGYTEIYEKNMPSIGSGVFSFVLPNKNIQANILNANLTKVGFFEATQTSGSFNFTDILLRKKDPVQNLLGFINLKGGSQQVIVNNLIVANVTTRANNQSFINMQGITGLGFVSVNNSIFSECDMEALINLRGPASRIFVQNLVAADSYFPLVVHEQPNPTDCLIGIQHVILSSHQSAWISSTGASMARIFDLIVANSTIQQNSILSTFPGGYSSIINSSFVANLVESPAKSTAEFANATALVQSVNFVYNTLPFVLTNSNVSVTSSNFAFNLAGDYKGACFFFDQSSFQVNSTFFINNTAPTGAAIYANVTPSNDMIYLSNNTFANNSETHYGAAVGGPPNIIVGNLSLVPRRVEALGQMFNSYLSYNMTAVQSGFRRATYNIQNVSTFLLNYTELKISLYNFRNELIQEGHNEFTVEIITNGQAELLETEATNGVLTINGTAIQLNSSLQTNTLNFVITYMKEQSFLDLNFILRECLPGEYVDNSTGLCVVCPAGTYSVDPTDSCRICPFGATCYGGNVVNIQAGFWMSPFNGFILQCPSEGCTGGFDTSEECAPGYMGGLCLGCNSSMDYSQHAAGGCKQCDSAFWNFILFFGKLIISFLFEVAYIYLVYRANRKTNKMNIEAVLSGVKLRNAIDTNVTGAQIKLFASYTQFLFIVAFYLRNSFFLDTYAIIYDFLAVSRVTAGPSYVATDVIECLFMAWGASPSDLPYDVLTFHLYFPVIKFGIYFLVVCLMSSKGKIKDPNLLITTAIVSFLLLEMIAPLQNMMQFNTCSFSGYVIGNYALSCNDPSYQSYSDNVGIPVVLVWGILIPVALFVMVYRNRDNLHDFSVRNLVGTMTNHYKEQAYYWSFVTLGLKLLLILMFTLMQDVQTGMSMGFIAVMIYYYISVRVEPYVNIELEKQENICIFAIASTMFLASIAIRTQYGIMTVIPVIMIILINFLVYVPSIWRIVFSVYRRRRGKHLQRGLLDRISTDPEEKKLDTMKIT